MWTIYLLMFITLVLGAGAWILFIWAVKSGQYDDPERPKYTMLEDDEEESPRK